MSEQTILVETRGRVGIIRLNRPQALNALNAMLKDELLATAERFDADPNVSCIVITGSDKLTRVFEISVPSVSLDNVVVTGAHGAESCEPGGGQAIS